MKKVNRLQQIIFPHQKMTTSIYEGQSGNSSVDMIFFFMSFIVRSSLIGKMIGSCNSLNYDINTFATSINMEGWFHNAARKIPPSVRFSLGSLRALSAILFSVSFEKFEIASLIL